MVGRAADGLVSIRSVISFEVCWRNCIWRVWARIPVWYHKLPPLKASPGAVACDTLSWYTLRHAMIVDSCRFTSSLLFPLVLVDRFHGVALLRTLSLPLVGFEPSYRSSHFMAVIHIWYIYLFTLSGAYVMEGGAGVRPPVQHLLQSHDGGRQATTTGDDMRLSLIHI